MTVTVLWPGIGWLSEGFVLFTENDPSLEPQDSPRPNPLEEMSFSFLSLFLAFLAFPLWSKKDLREKTLRDTNTRVL